MKTISIDWNYLFTALIASIFFLPFLGGVHLFDWDEINFAECSREMILRGDYLRPQINFEPFWEKPPLFFWLQSASMHLFGVNEYAARFPNAVCGIVTLLVVYHIGKKLYNKMFGLLWAMAYFGSLLPHLYFKSGIIDPWFNLFIFLSLVFLIKSDEDTPPQYKRYNLLFSGIFSGLAILTKGPVGFLIVSLTWLAKLFIFKELSIKKIKNLTIVALTALGITLLWFGIETVKNGTWFIKTFIEYNIRLAKTEDAGHGGFVGYHFIVLLFGCFPASIFALRTLFTRYNFMGEKVDFTRWMKVLFWVVLILFSIVQSKIVHYSSMCYLPLTFLGAITLKTMADEQRVFNYINKSVLIVGVFIGVLVAVIPFIGQNIRVLKPLFQKDIFALKNLDAAVTWTGVEAIVGIFLIFMTNYAFFLIKTLKILRGGIAVFFTTAIFLNLVLFFYIKNIENYSQNAAIKFYETRSKEDCYIVPFGFKSYAHLFYGKKQIPTNTQHKDADWLLRGAVDKPTYWVAKYGSKAELDTVSTLQYLYDKNGFVFYKRR